MMHTLMDEQSTTTASTEAPALGTLVVALLKGVLYQDADGKRWADLLMLQNRVRDYVTVMGLELVLDEAEGYAFLKAREIDEASPADTAKADVPRLVARRQLSFPVSLLLALLRKKMAEFDATGGETRLVLTRDDMVELIRLFLPDSSNEARLMDQVERHINKVAELGFIKNSDRLPPASRKRTPTPDTKCAGLSRPLLTPSGFPISMPGYNPIARNCATGSERTESKMNSTPTLAPSLGLDFTGEDELSGFRLHRLEVLNWGTFDQQIWTLNLHGKMAC